MGDFLCLCRFFLDIFRFKVLEMNATKSTKFKKYILRQSLTM